MVGETDPAMRYVLNLLQTNMKNCAASEPFWLHPLYSSLHASKEVTQMVQVENTLAMTHGPTIRSMMLWLRGQKQQELSRSSLLELRELAS